MQYFCVIIFRKSIGMHRFRLIILVISTLALLAACSTTKYVPDGEYLLDEVRIRSDNDDIRGSSLSPYLRQTPNSKWFSLIKTQLYVYNWSGPDTTRWINRTLRRLGDAPVIYDEGETRQTADELTKAVRNMGYMGATVTPRLETRKKKARLTYEIRAGEPYLVRTVSYDIPDTLIHSYIRRDSAATLLHTGMYFDVNVLDAERQRITSTLRRNGYYRFNKEYLEYVADTVRGSRDIDLTLRLLPFRVAPDSFDVHRQYTVDKVGFVADYDALHASLQESIDVNDSIHYHGLPIYYKDHLYLRPQVLASNLAIRPGSLYDEQAVQRTYSNFGRLQALRYTNVRFFPSLTDSTSLNAYVLLTRSKHKSVSFELEGTNSAGDLGAAAAVSFQHRIDLLDINYLYMPWIEEGFKHEFLDEGDNYILRYNYENRFIVRTGYSFTYNNAGQALVNNTVVGNSYAIRVNLESAGNLLYGIAKLAGMKQNEQGEYTLLNIPFAQYVKADFDFAKNIVIDNRNSLAFHFGAGIVVPYGNATMVPFEKRYFSGGANSVRGWSVRDLGPGSFPGDGNFLNQSGDIKLDASIEYRTRLFWKFRGAVFVDAGNIWTLRDYPDQPGGKFEFDTFYKQIAVAYGLGLRLDLDFFVLRFDGGMKAINPVYESGRGRYPIIHPDFKRDFVFHFAVGYPF